jgi:hypothetical protein
MAHPTLPKCWPAGGEQLENAPAHRIAENVECVHQRSAAALRVLR